MASAYNPIVRGTPESLKTAVEAALALGQQCFGYPELNFDKMRFAQVMLTGAPVNETSPFASPSFASGSIVGLSRGTLAAAGSTSADAALIVEQVSLVTGSDNAKGVALPAASTTGGPFIVVNTVATASLLVYPVDGGNDNINALAEDAAFVVGPGEMAIFTATSATQWYCASRAGVKAKVLTGTYTVLAAENGTTYYLNSATEFVTTLPAPFLGARYEFVVMAAPSGASYTVVSGSSANIIKGLHNSAAGDAGDSGTADDTISFVDGQAVAGDLVVLRSDGTSWFAAAQSKLAAGITFTQAS